MSQINPNVYPTKYKISCADRDGSNVVEFSDDIAKLLVDGKLSLSEYMDGSNSYCGFEPGKYNYWVGGALFSVTNGDPNDPRSGNWVNYTTSANKINFRWCLKVANGGDAPQGNMIQRWTPQKPPEETIGAVYDIDHVARYDSLMTGRQVLCYYGHSYSTFYRMYPITNINIDRIQISPLFHVVKAVPTYTDGIITRYSTEITSYRWEDIKPEDDTPEGEHYNADLWSKGWYDEIDENTGNIAARYILVNCAVKAQYGTFKFDRSVSGSMNGRFGESLNVARWDADEDKVIPSNISNPTGYLVPMAEVPFKVKNEEGVLFQTLSGIDFPASGSVARGTNNPSSTVQYTYSDSAYGQSRYAAVSAEGNTITHSTINRGGGFLLNWNLDDMDGSFTMVTNGIGTDIVDKIYASTTGVTQCFFNTDGSISRNNVHNTTSATVALELTPFSLESLWATLASLGVWVITDINSLPDDFELGVDFPTNVYRGEVLEDGTTTGRMFQGEDAEQQPWDTIDYTPVIPTPTPPGPGPINPPDEGDWGSDIPYTIFQMGNSPFSNFEQLDYNGLEEFMAKLWHAPQTFWESLSATKELSANLNDYLISCRAYPIFVNGGAAHHDIYLGVGGKITLNNTIYTPSIVNLCACGSITVGRPYGNFLDYNPYTSASIYLPFAGQFEINPKYIYDTQLNLMLWVDLTDGSGVWVLRNLAHNYPILIKQCKVGIDIPISGQDAAQKSSNIINATLNTAQHALTSVNRITGIATQVGTAIASGGISGGSGINIGTEAAGMALAGLSDSVNMAMANKELPYYTTGSAGAAAAEACSEPYITLRTPLCENPANFAHTVGNLYNKAALISSLSGFTTCRNVDVSGISQATDKEKAQIKQILESGFYA